MTEKEFKKVSDRWGSKNLGLYHKRMKHKCEQSTRELAFSREWRKEARPVAWRGHGNGILQGLFTSGSRYPARFEDAAYLITKISPRERLIVATVIQWLGSNVGWSFLCKVLDKAGYRIVRK